VGGRADFALSDRFTLIAELFNQGEGSAKYQIGLRTTIIEEHLLTDLSYGYGFGRVESEDRIGLVLGVAWTPPPFR
jgi:hypothetical protein